MTVNVEITKKALLHAPLKIENLNEKELVPKMMVRRRLTRNARILINLADQCNFTSGHIIYGTAYGEVSDTIAILDAIKNKEVVSPTSFQNSVYNTAASYHSIVQRNTSEIMTLSCGDNTSYNVMQQAALTLFEQKEVFACVTESINFHDVDSLNKCENELEFGVAFMLQRTDKDATFDIKNTQQVGVPNSVSYMKNIYEACHDNKDCIIEIEL